MVDLKTDEIISTGTFWAGLIIAFVIVALIAGILLSVLMPPTIIKPITIISDIMGKAAAGDFSVRVPTGFGAEVGQLIDACNTLNSYNDANVQDFVKLVLTIRESSQGLLAISSQMAENSVKVNE